MAGRRQSSATIDVPACAPEGAACLVCGATRSAVAPAVGAAGLAVVRCLGCGLGWSRPAASPAAPRGAAFVTPPRPLGRSSSHLERALGDHPARGSLRGWMAELLRDVAAASAGRGERLRLLQPLARPLAEALFDVVVPLDGRRGLAVIALGDATTIAALAARGCDVTVVDDDGSGVATPDPLAGPAAVDAGVYDVAVVGAALAETRDPLAALRAVAARLRPGARLHLVVPNGSAATPAPAARWLFDAASLATLVEAAGLRVVRGPVARGARRLARRWLDDRRRLGLGAASRRGARCLAVALRTAGSGELLRLEAERV